MPDLARDGLRNLQARSLRAIMAAPTWAAQLAVQRDVVEGARRLTEALERERRAARPRDVARLNAAWTAAVEYRAAAEVALAGYEQRASLEAGQ